MSLLINSNRFQSGHSSLDSCNLTFNCFKTCFIVLAILSSCHSVIGFNGFFFFVFVCVFVCIALGCLIFFNCLLFATMEAAFILARKYPTFLDVLSNERKLEVW